ncbi:hypothetical protein LIER_20043 [Lithospermum erythrorhizon]|uniref:Uncharacterized protein n=1 Tax=Lithospermum erythrorhizon TaxID=34254 RepID=A0AAV3QK02_LITER
MSKLAYTLVLLVLDSRDPNRQHASPIRQLYNGGTSKAIPSNSYSISNDCLTGKCFTTSWIIDSDVSIHVTADILILTHIIDLPGCPIDFPDGKLANAIKYGRVQLFSGLILYDVLHMP